MLKLSFSLLGTLVTTALLTASIFMNWRYGFSLGRTVIDGIIYGVASASADGLKALSPFFGLWAVRQRSWLAALFSVVIWLICSVFSFTSALGFAALNRLDSATSRIETAKTYARFSQKRDRLTQKIDLLPVHQPASIIQQQLNAHKQHMRWISSDKCTNATVTPSQIYCHKYFNLKTELATSEKSTLYHQQLNKLLRKRERLGKNSADKPPSGTADPQADILSHLTGIAQKEIQTGLIFLMALLTELGSGLGYFISLAHLVPAKQSTKLQDLAKNSAQQKIVPAKPYPSFKLLPSPSGNPREAFFIKALIHNPTSTIQASDLYHYFLDWCRSQNIGPDMTMTAFGRWTVAVGGCKKTKIGGKIQYLEIQISRDELFQKS